MHAASALTKQPTGGTGGNAMKLQTLLQYGEEPDNFMPIVNGDLVEERGEKLTPPGNTKREEEKGAKTEKGRRRSSEEDSKELVTDNTKKTSKELLVDRTTKNLLVDVTTKRKPDSSEEEKATRKPKSSSEEEEEEEDKVRTRDAGSMHEVQPLLSEESTPPDSGLVEEDRGAEEKEKEARWVVEAHNKVGGDSDEITLGDKKKETEKGSATESGTSHRPGTEDDGAVADLNRLWMDPKAMLNRGGGDSISANPVLQEEGEEEDNLADNVGLLRQFWRDLTEGGGGAILGRMETEEDPGEECRRRSDLFYKVLFASEGIDIRERTVVELEAAPVAEAVAQEERVGGDMKSILFDKDEVSLLMEENVVVGRKGASGEEEESYVQKFLLSLILPPSLPFHLV